MVRLNPFEAIAEISAKKRKAQAFMELHGIPLSEVEASIGKLPEKFRFPVRQLYSSRNEDAKDAMRMIADSLSEENRSSEHASALFKHTGRFIERIWRNRKTTENLYELLKEGIKLSDRLHSRFGVNPRHASLLLDIAATPGLDDVHRLAAVKAVTTHAESNYDLQVLMQTRRIAHDSEAKTNALIARELDQAYNKITRTRPSIK